MDNVVRCMGQALSVTKDVLHAFIALIKAKKLNDIFISGAIEIMKSLLLNVTLLFFSYCASIFDSHLVLNCKIPALNIVVEFKALSIGQLEKQYCLLV